jgi:hypothetical protein
MEFYREGNEEDSEEETPTETPTDKEPGKPEEKKEDAETKVEAGMPATAFLVLKFDDGRIDLMVDPPGIKKKRRSSLPEVRDMATALANNLQAEITSSIVLSRLSQSMQQVRKSTSVPMTQAQMSRIKNNPFGGKR